MTRDDERAVRRLLGLLARGAGTVKPAAAEGRLICEVAGVGAVAIEQRLLVGLETDGATRRSGDCVVLLEAGRSRLRRPDGDADGFRAQHQDRRCETRLVEGDWEQVTVDLAESPLASMASRKGRDGKPLLRQIEVAAGERLRSDYTRGQLMPGLGVNWSSAGGGSTGSGRTNRTAELTDAALSARRRVDEALDFVGPELSGVLVDVCCFLKGLEAVEAERRWPARSAKLLLRSALSMLSRHYWPRQGSGEGRPRRVLHWGSADYRPRIDGSCGELS